MGAYSGLLIDIDIYVCLRGVVNCIFVHLHSTTSLLLLPLTANQTLLELHHYIFGLLPYFAFYLYLPYRGCFGSDAIFSSKSRPVEGGVRVGDLVYMCVCTQLCYSASVLRSNANKSNSWNLKWQNFSPFSQSGVCFRTQCCVSFMWGERISHQEPGVWQQGA